jgi:hypothetical protein
VDSRADVDISGHYCRSMCCQAVVVQICLREPSRGQAGELGIRTVYQVWTMLIVVHSTWPHEGVDIMLHVLLGIALSPYRS